MLVPLLALQLATAASSPPDSTYSSAALAAFIAAAAKDNRVPPAALRGYRARVESELSLLVRDSLGRERIAQVEQLAMSADWEREQRYDLRVIGYRSETVGVPYSALSFARSWTIPILYGDRLTMGVDFGQDRPARQPRDSQPSTAIRAVHPLSTDRERFYRFSGGDTIAVLRLRDRRVPIVRVHVRPVLDSAARAGRIGAFEGEIDFDAERHEIVRMRGQFVATEGHRRRLSLGRLPGVVGVAYLELVNAEVDGRYWLPAYQRSEFQAAFAPLGANRSIFRLVSRFMDVTVRTAGDSITLAGAPAVSDSDRELPPYGRRLTYATADSVSGYREWSEPLGIATTSVHASDFDDLAPDVWRVGGRPRFDVAPTKLEEMFRYNRVEGLYTGVAGDERFRDVAPGLSAHVFGGWAWSEQTPRGGASLSFQRGPWRSSARAERLLASTNDFVPPLEGGSEGFGALFAGADDHDYVDRRVAAFDLTRRLGGDRGTVVTLEAGVGDDRSERARVAESPFRIGHFRLNRASLDGRYLRGATVVEIHPDVTGMYLEPGIGAILNYEVAAGQLSWQRAEITLAARKSFSDFVIALRGQAGVVAGASIPPQALLELGGENALPGYGYKQFGGDRAAAAGALAAYTFPLLRKPLRLVRSLMLPGLSPGLAAGVQSGWAEASTAAARSSLQALDPAAVEGCAMLDNCPLPLSKPTHGIRATADVRLTLFGGLVGLGLARPIDSAASWRFAFRFAQEY